MGTVEKGLDAPTIFRMDQVEAHARWQLRQLVQAQQILSEMYGDDTSPTVLATMIAEAAAKEGNAAAHVLLMENIVALATKLLVQSGWPNNGPVSVAS